MVNREYTTLRVVLLGAIGVMSAMTLTIIGTVASVIVLSLMIDQIFFGGAGGKWVYRKTILRKPFDVYSEPEKDVVERLIKLSTSHGNQCFNITLKMGAELWVEFIALGIRGQGSPPEILKLYDWQWGYERELLGIDTYYVRAQNVWYWRYHSRHHRHKKSRITIGVECLAKSPFKGELEVALTAEEIAGNIRLPLQVKEKSQA